MFRHINKIPAVLAAAAILASGIIWVYNHDQSLARASSVLVLRAQIQAVQTLLKEDQDLRRARDLDERIWILEQRYEGKVMPISVKEEIYRLKVELKELRKEN